MLETLTWQAVVLAVVAIASLAMVGAAALLAGIDGALFPTLIGGVIAVLVIVVLKKIPGA